MNNKIEPKRHHYIPQFILRNFNNEKTQVYYWDIKISSLGKRNVKSVFMNWHMYRDEKLNNENPTQIEHKLSVFESEIAEIISKKILNKNEITLTRKELERLRIFITLLSFRSNLRMEQYKNSNFDIKTKSILLQFQPDGNFEELWKKELDILAECRSYAEIENSSIIDPIIKLDFLNALKGYYMSLVDARDEEFLLSDVYPTLEIFPLPNANIHMHVLFPISPTKLLILNHIMFKDIDTTNPLIAPMIKLSQIKGSLITPPQSKLKKSYGEYCSDDEFIYTVRKIYSEDVKYINSLILNEARVGIIFKNKDKIINSIITYNTRKDTKQSFKELENKLIKG